jgi:HSP20 family protein
MKEVLTMALIRFPEFTDFRNPFQELSRVRREMDRLLSDLVSGSPSTIRSGVFPAVNVSEDANNIYVYAEIPGIKADGLDITVEGNTLSLRGERAREDVANASYHRRERRAGSFHKAINLPAEINADAVVAECKHGVLKLVLPKAEHAKPKKIAVKTE